MIIHQGNSSKRWIIIFKDSQKSLLATEITSEGARNFEEIRGQEVRGQILRQTGYARSAAPLSPVSLPWNRTQGLRRLFKNVQMQGLRNPEE